MTKIKREVTATAGNSGRPVSYEMSAGDISVRLLQMPDRRWYAGRNYADLSTVGQLPYQMPQHATAEQAIEEATASIRAAERNVTGSITLADAVTALAARVSSIPARDA